MSEGNVFPIVVAIEGLIGAGKSTLVDKIKRNDPTVQILKEDINPSLLSLFYTDPAKYGFAMQWAALQQRIYQSKLLAYQKREVDENGKDKCPAILWDRSMLGDYAFALWNHLTGNLDEAEMAAYESMFGASVTSSNIVPVKDIRSSQQAPLITSSPFVAHVDKYIWLIDDPMECKRRVELRQSNPAEQGIPDQYYRGLEDVHIFLFLKLLADPEVRGKVKVVRWDQYSQIDKLSELIEEHKCSADYQLILKKAALPTGVVTQRAHTYDFYTLSDPSKLSLYEYLSNGGNPQHIIVAD